MRPKEPSANRDTKGPKLDGVVFHCLLGGEKPLSAITPEWDFHFGES